jgi:hypothetical protein
VSGEAEKLPILEQLAALVSEITGTFLPVEVEVPS